MNMITVGSLMWCMRWSFLCTYHKDVDEVSRGGVPHLQRQIVGCGDHRAVVAIPCYHGNLQLGHLVFQWWRVVLPAPADTL